MKKICYTVVSRMIDMLATLQLVACFILGGVAPVHIIKAICRDFGGG